MRQVKVTSAVQTQPGRGDAGGLRHIAAGVQVDVCIRSSQCAIDRKVFAIDRDVTCNRDAAAKRHVGIVVTIGAGSGFADGQAGRIHNTQMG